MGPSIEQEGHMPCLCIVTILQQLLQNLRTFRIVFDDVLDDRRERYFLTKPGHLTGDLRGSAIASALPGYCERLCATFATLLPQFAVWAPVLIRGVGTAPGATALASRPASVRRWLRRLSTAMHAVQSSAEDTCAVFLYAWRTDLQRHARPRRPRRLWLRPPVLVTVTVR